MKEKRRDEFYPLAHFTAYFEEGEVLIFAKILGKDKMFLIMHFMKYRTESTNSLPA